MNNIQTHSLLQLPLSWARTTTTDPQFDMVKLPYSSPGWIPTAEIPHHYSFDEVYREHLRMLPNGFVLQSCSVSLRDYLIEQGCQVVAMGAEAILDLPWRGKRSVRELARRGRRHGAVREIELSNIHQRKLVQLSKESPSRQRSQLRHIERPQFDSSTRCFVLEGAEGDWLGAITLSSPSPNYAHTEMLLRSPDAPVGVMEAIVTAIAEQLADEGVQHLSLGNVTPLPFEESEKIMAPHRHPKELWTLSQLSFRLGRAFNFAYNAEGLWRFKNKFTPRWEPLYLCASPRLSWQTMAGLVQATGYFNLVWSHFQVVLSRSMPRVRLPIRARCTPVPSHA